jgi:hypothetical protein
MSLTRRTLLSICSGAALVGAAYVCGTLPSTSMTQTPTPRMPTDGVLIDKGRNASLQP